MEEMELMMQLAELGFPPERIQKAIKETKAESLDAALDYLQNEQNYYEEPINENDKSLLINDDSGPSSNTKINKEELKNEPTIKRVEELNKKLAEKQKLSESREEEESKQQELQRRKEGRDLLALKRERDLIERKKMLKEKRQEAEDEKKRRERVLAMIKEDRKNQDELVDRVGSINEPVVKEKLHVQTTSCKSDNVRIMIRGLLKPLMLDLSSDCTLDDVLARIEEEYPDTMEHYKLIVTLPHREFLSEEYKKSLLDLGLVSSIILTLSKRR